VLAAGQPQVRVKRPGTANPVATKPGAAAAPTPVPVASPLAGQSAAQLNQAAMQALLQGHTAAAADLYTRATKSDPRNAAAFRGLGLTNEKLGRKDEAIKAFKRALQLAPDGREAESIRSRLQKLGAEL
jgi:tetratricopeptide (TPR) repeat protein